MKRRSERTSALFCSCPSANENDNHSCRNESTTLQEHHRNPESRSTFYCCHRRTSFLPFHSDFFMLLVRVHSAPTINKIPTTNNGPSNALISSINGTTYMLSSTKMTPIRISTNTRIFPFLDIAFYPFLVVVEWSLLSHFKGK